MGAFFALARAPAAARAHGRGGEGAPVPGARALSRGSDGPLAHTRGGERAVGRARRWRGAPARRRARPLPRAFFFFGRVGKCRRMASCRQWGRADARPRGQQRARPRAARGTDEDATAPRPRSRAFACAAGEREGGEEGRSARVLSASTATLSSGAADAVGCAAADRRAPLASGRPGGVCARRRQRRYAPRCAHPSPLQPMLTQPLSHAPSPVAPE